MSFVKLCSTPAIRLNLQFTSKRLASTVTASAYDILKSNGDVGILTKLKNGLNVASYNNGRPTATVGVWIEAGSVFENSGNNGVATLYEHLLYTGTNSRTATQLQNELAKIGARLKSFTDRDHTAYYAECMSADVDKVMTIITDVLRNTKLEAGKIEEQRAVVLKKLEEGDGDYRATVMDNLHKTAFQGTPYSLSPLGNTNTLLNITRQDLIDYADDTYKPSRMALIAVGGVDHETLLDLAEKHLSDLSNEYKRKIPQEESIRFSGSEFMYRDDNYPLMYGAIAVEGVHLGDHDALPLQVASTAVGQWDRTHAATVNSPSIIIQKVYDNKDLLYYENFSHSYQRTGLFGFYFVAKGNNDTEILNGVRNIQRQWKHMACNVTDEEIDRAKNSLKTNLFKKLENNTQLADHVAQEVLSTGTLTPLHTLERKIHYISASAIREAVSRHAYDRDTANAGIGRTEAFPQYLMFRYGMSWWRL